MLRPSAPWLVGLVAWLITGCPAVHERPTGGTPLRDAGAVDARSVDASTGDTGGTLCLPEGTYEVRASISDETPVGCTGFAGPVSYPVHIPPIEEDFRGMCEDGSVAIVPSSTLPCAWSVITDCPIPDASTHVEGSISARATGVEGAFAVRFEGFTGTCNYTVHFAGTP